MAKCPAARDFCSAQAIFLREYWMYFKGKWCGAEQKEPLSGRFDIFQIGSSQIKTNVL